MSVAAVVLAAGASRRLGELKQLVRLRGEMLLERTVNVCRRAGCTPVVVVLGASAAEVQSACPLGDAVVIVNEDWAEGMGASLGTGVRALGKEVSGCVVMTCDMPAVSEGHLRELMRSGKLTASAYAGRSGVPAYFPRAMFGLLVDLHGDAGARQLLKEADALDLPGGELDIDTEEDLKKARELFSRHSPEKDA